MASHVVAQSGAEAPPTDVKQLYDKSCASCHGNDGHGTDALPRLAGQHADYIVRQLKVFKTPLRPHGVIMKDEVKAMTSLSSPLPTSRKTSS